VTFIAAIFAAAALSVSAEAVDRCQPLVPPGLAKQIATTYPGHRLPRGNDQDTYNVRYNLKHGGSGCLGVATGDFDGDKTRDIALMLTAKGKPGGLLVVALRRGTHWLLELVEPVEDPISNQYVGSVKPGKYGPGPFWGESPPGPSEMETIESSTEGVVTGMLESTARYYFRLEGKWRFVWVSD
jgi:hypothetical protein